MNNSLVSENLGLVHACCKRFKGRGIEYEELYSAGCVGLVKAVNRFKPELGLQLSTYAVPVILGELRQLFRDNGTVRVSRGLKELYADINKLTEEFQEKHSRPPTVSELSEQLGVTPERINDALTAAQLPLSLTSESDDDGRSIDIPCDDIAEGLTEKLALREVIGELSPDDRKIIELRYYKRLTQTKTAKILNMTQVQISRREKKILLYMRGRLG